MNRLKILTVVFCLVLACGVFLPAARADQWNQKMEITFNKPIEVPGVVLPAGTYWFVLADLPSDRYVMRVYSQDWSTLYATTLTVPTLREQAHGKLEVELAERRHDNPEALYKVYYPGSLTGQQFIYHHREERALRRDAKLDLLTTPTGVASSTTIPGE